VDAAWALDSLEDVRAIEPLIQLLGKSEPGEFAAAVALGKIGDARVIEPLIGLLGRRNHYLYDSAAQALGRLGDPRSVVTSPKCSGAATLVLSQHS
jgi:HEAT repeat protein